MQEVNPKIPSFTPTPWLNDELSVKGIYLRYKVISKAITANWDYSVECWFAPKIIFASCVDWNDTSDWSSDFSLSFSIRKYNNWGVFNASESSTKIVHLSSMEVATSTRLYNWFTITVSSFTGWSKNIYFTCLS